MLTRLLRNNTGSVSMLLQSAPSLLILLSLDSCKWGKRSGKSETRTSSVGVEDPPIVLSWWQQAGLGRGQMGHPSSPSQAKACLPFIFLRCFASPRLQYCHIVADYLQYSVVVFFRKKHPGYSQNYTKPTKTLLAIFSKSQPWSHAVTSFIFLKRLQSKPSAFWFG